MIKKNSGIMTKPDKKHEIIRTLVLFCLLITLIATTLSGCGENKQIVGQWQMTKVLVGEQEYDAATFLDPTLQADSSFIIQFYGDNTLIATGSLDTMKGASEGIWEKEKDDEFSLTIDDQERIVKLVGDLLFMDINIEESTIVIIFERQSTK